MDRKDERVVNHNEGISTANQSEDRIISKEWEDVLKKALAAALIAGGGVILSHLKSKE